MNYLEILPTEILILCCEYVSTTDLVNLVRAYRRAYLVCNKLLSHRKEQFIKKKEIQRWISKLKKPYDYVHLRHPTRSIITLYKVVFRSFDEGGRCPKKYTFVLKLYITQHSVNDTWLFPDIKLNNEWNSDKLVLEALIDWYTSKFIYVLDKLYDVGYRYIYGLE